MRTEKRILAAALLLSLALSAGCSTETGTAAAQEAAETAAAAETTADPAADTAAENTEAAEAAAGSAAESAETAGITLEQAEAIALDQAGLQASDVTFTEEKLDTKDGVYELEFRTADQSEYECEIYTATGEILSWDFEAGTADASGTAVTADEARALALAQVPGATESSFTEFKSDYENGRLIYEGEIVFDGMEYEFEIDADTGTLLSWESDQAD